ncbi:MAG TPA: cytochrome c, partial [Longimicrobium sp.]|nr:cytochrome c [Longimicrobium sp.]
VLVLSVGVIYAASEMRFRREVELATASPLTVRPDPSLASRGEHFALAIGKCGDCHGPDLGGRVFIDGGPLGTIIAPNLTTGRGGVLASYTDEQLERAIRHGVGSDGRSLFIMPSQDYYAMSDGDLAALIAYLRTIPAVDREHPETRIGPLGRALYMAGKLPLVPAERMDHAAPRTPPAPGVTVEYGRYLATVGGCTSCHGKDLAGGIVEAPGTPPSANLTPAGIGTWTEEDFFNALRKGLRPDKSGIDPFMPWASTARMTDDEIRAVWMYLRTVPAKETPKA